MNITPVPVYVLFYIPVDSFSCIYLGFTHSNLLEYVLCYLHVVVSSAIHLIPGQSSIYSLNFLHVQSICTQFFRDPVPRWQFCRTKYYFLYVLFRIRQFLRNPLPHSPRRLITGVLILSVAHNGLFHNPVLLHFHWDLLAYTDFTTSY